MIHRKWITTLVFLFALAVPAHAQPQGNSQQRESEKDNTSPEQPNPGSSHVPVGGAPIQTKGADQALAQTKIYQPDCRKPKDHDEADLCAQGRVAEAAEKTLQLTLAQTAIGALGVFFVIITLGFTARANKAAAIAAQAAVDAVNAERAWLSFDDLHRSKGPGRLNGVQYDVLLIYSPIWVNTGRSPALKAGVFVNFSVLPFADPAPNFTPNVDPNKTAIIGPGIKYHGTPFVIGGDDIERFLKREAYIAFYTRVEYETVGSPGITKFTEICARLEFDSFRIVDGDQRIVTNISPEGPQNSAT